MHIVSSYVSDFWLVAMDSVLDGSLLHILRAAARAQPAAHLLCHPAGSWHDHGEIVVFLLFNIVLSRNVYILPCV